MEELTDEQAKMMAEMLRRADEAGVDATENLAKIAKARVRMHRDITVCPCHPDDTDRGCISAKCLREIEEEGVCSCTAYQKRTQ